jgi:hypothetical protein
MKKRQLLFGIVNSMIITLFLIGLSSPADAQRKTRDLVFEDEESPATQKKSESKQQAVVAVKTTLELERDGQKSTVLPNHQFVSGDKVKFMYTTNVDCYIYWLSQGSSGEYYMLFPNPKAGTDNWIKKNEVYQIPVKGTFKFDEKKGVEKILLVMSPEKVPELEQAAKEAALKGGTVSSSATGVSSVEKDQATKRKTRDLVFEDDEDTSSKVSTKSQVSSDIRQPFVAYYELVHN